MLVSLSAKRAERKTPFPPLTLYRALTYDDVIAVGKASGVTCSCLDGTITLRLRAAPTAP